MFLLHQSNLSHKHALIAMCVFFGLSQSGIAGPRDALIAPSKPDTQLADEIDDDQLENLSGVSIEDRIRLRMDLRQYSRNSDPIHTQIEDRRRLMNKGVQERFLGADRDNDGLLSRQEVVDSLPQVARHYNQVDLDTDGYISITELVGFHEKITERQRAAEIRIRQAREAELKEAEIAAENEVATKQTSRPKMKSKQAEIVGKPSL